MNILYGLALALIFFERFISQCKATGGSEASVSENLQRLPLDLIEEILFRVGLSATAQAAADDQRTIGVAKKIFANYIIYICPRNTQPRAREQLTDLEDFGDHYLLIQGPNRIQSLFTRFGRLINRIKFDYVLNNASEVTRSHVNENIIMKHARQFTELHIVTNNSFSEFLDELPCGKKNMFPTVNKLSYQGPYFGASFKLDSIFPKLRSLALCTNPVFEECKFMQIDMTCMKKVAKLTELKLEITRQSYDLPELEIIFKKNKQLSTLRIGLNDKIDILRSIGEHMTNLQTLEIKIDSTQCLELVPENHTFFMPPTLKRLILFGSCEDPMIINFINSFKNLETLDLRVSNNFIISNIENLVEIQELVTYHLARTIDLKKAFQNFGKNENLNKIKWINVNQSRCDQYKSKAIKINAELKKSEKPTWNIICTKYKGRETMMFRREN